MKRILTSFFIFGFTLWTGSSCLRAQTNVNIYNAYQYASQSCTVPVTANFYCQAIVGGYQSSDTANFHVDFGDGNFINASAALYYNAPGQYWTFSGNISHTYNTAGVYAITYICTLPDGNADTTYSELMITSTCNNVTGQVYIDVNNDCLYNTGDIALSALAVNINYNGFTVSSGSTNASGIFTLSACPGYTYSILPDTSGYYYSSYLPLICSTYYGMTITPSPNASQDFVVDNITALHISSAGDSANYWASCVPYTSNFFMNVASLNYFYPNDTLDLYLNFGDGHDTTLHAPANSTYPVSSVNAPYIEHTYTAPGNYNVLYVATGPDGRTDSLIHYNEIVVNDTCGNIEGIAYLDNNNNCVFDSGTDSLFAWMSLYAIETSSNSMYMGYTDANGHYSFSVPPGNYNVYLNSYYLSYTQLTPTCPASGMSTVTVTASNTVNSDFAMICPVSFDLTGYIGIYHGIFPTSNGYIHPYLNNLSCMTTGGTVTFILDPLVNYVGVCDTTFAPIVNGDTLTWNFTGATNFYSWYMWFATSGCIEIIGDPALQPGDSVCFTMIIDPMTGDMNPANNTITRCVPAFVSLDPNVKDVEPRGTGPQGYVPQQTTFNYTIDYQNTGTAAARNIFVLDTLDADLDLTTLVVTGSSHAMEIQMLPGNVLKFNFPDIWLADSSSDEQHSHGWITYRITAKPSLANGTQIQNKAGIYFDFNPPVITNSTLNTIYDPASVNEISANDAFVFPNPASSSVEIKFSKETNAVYMLTDVTGKEVTSGKINGMTATIDVSKLTQGVYFLQLNNEEGRSVRKIIVQH